MWGMIIPLSAVGLASNRVPFGSVLSHRRDEVLVQLVWAFVTIVGIAAGACRVAARRRRRLLEMAEKRQAEAREEGKDAA